MPAAGRQRQKWVKSLDFSRRRPFLRPQSSPTLIFRQATPSLGQMTPPELAVRSSLAAAGEEIFSRPPPISTLF